MLRFKYKGNTLKNSNFSLVDKTSANIMFKIHIKKTKSYILNLAN